ncbi:PEP-CTERM sorting domain-containing protein [Alteromonas sp. 1_MG-2023]|uniref:exosortase-dependent surface protein XDP1 n=1 Tax=Alteromonas sp. 1_MG-2023 TaxID=3062669 RepID=UPI0026E3AAF8|nr:exosortase-dependent surface protein XDP1 [Alteromonas sp. 1_MG-2023]MDO6566144.1 PEP-CTERM sorting domain-containing protein [Alteromonas sp. 1_MG-2023]
MRLINISILTASLIGLSSLSASYASAGSSKWKDSDYSSCGSSKSSSSSACESALGENIYDLVDDGVYEGTSTSSSTTIIDGVTIAVAAFSDTAGITNETVVQSELEKISNTWAYGVTNDDEAYYSGSYDHAIDNLNYFYEGSNAADKYNVTNVERDYDFVLFSFDEAVTVTDASFSWVFGSDSQISIAALDDISGLTSGTQTWDGIVADALTTASYDITNSSSSTPSVEFDLTDTAQYWLLGAYNTVFGNIGGYVGNDAFKLSGLGFSVAENASPPAPSTEVNEPTTIGLLMAGALFIAWRRKFPSSKL